MRKEEKTENEVVYPIPVIDIDSTDIAVALMEFDEDVQDVLKEMIWDMALLNKIAIKMRGHLQTYYPNILADTIREVLNDEIEKAKRKQKFFSGLMDFIKNRNKKK
jgi:hypothetical protein